MPKHCVACGRRARRFAWLLLACVVPLGGWLAQALHTVSRQHDRIGVLETTVDDLRSRSEGVDGRSRYLRDMNALVAGAVDRLTANNDTLARSNEAMTKALTEEQSRANATASQLAQAQVDRRKLEEALQRAALLDTAAKLADGRAAKAESELVRLERENSDLHRRCAQMTETIRDKLGIKVNQ